MTEQQAGWYDDPTNRYMYRYWNGAQWVDQVSSGTTNSTDPTPMDPSAAATPPAPGTAAPTPSQPATAPTVQVTQKGGMGFGAILGVILAVVAIGVLIVVLMNNSGDDSSTPTTAAPATTEAPATTTAP
ncbi:MAG: DUF2510 domain-containing protein [Acidimicrobiia bacterium]